MINPRGAAVASAAEIPAEAAAIVAFWREAGPELWFAKDAAFDERFRERFLALYEQAARGRLDGWRETADGAMALVILLDQFPRNAFRGTSRIYATGERARHIADLAIAAGHDIAFEPALRLFIYLPFGHSESLADQDRAPWRSASPPFRMPGTSATSSAASAGSRIATRSSADR